MERHIEVKAEDDFKIKSADRLLTDFSAPQQQAGVGVQRNIPVADGRGGMETKKG